MTLHSPIISVRFTLPPPVTPGMRFMPLVSQIVDAASDLTGFTPAELIGPVRERRLVHVRFSVYYVAQRLTGKSLPLIGRLLGGRDHKTILYGIRRARELLRSDPAFARMVEALMARFGGAA
jgi:chromosomal replication initiator protein